MYPNIIRICGLVIVAFLVNAAAADAQNALLSQEIALGNNEDYRLIGRIRDTTVVLLYENDRLGFALYDAALSAKIVEKKAFERNNIDVLQATTDKNGFTLLYRYNASGRSNAKLARFNSQAKLQDSVTLQSVSQWGIAYDPTVVLSEDKQKLLLYDMTSNGSEVIATSFDLTTFRRLWTRRIVLTGMDYNNSLRQTVIDNDGGAYFIIERDNRKSKSANNRFEVVYYHKDLSEPVSVSIGLNGRLWQDVLFAYDNKNKNLLGAGFFSTKKSSQSEGSFFIQQPYPISAKAALLQFEPFENAFLQQVTGKEQRRNGSFQDFTVQQIVPRSDGGALLVAEYYKKYTRTMGGGYGMNQGVGFRNVPPYVTRITTDYEYNDILLLSMYPSGTIQWKEMLPKRQFSQDDDALYSSFFLLKNKMGLRFIYNDAIKTGGNVYEYTLLPDGMAQRRSIYNAEKEKLALIFREAKQVSTTEVVVPSFVRNKMRLVVFKY